MTCGAIFAFAAIVCATLAILGTIGVLEARQQLRRLNDRRFERQRRRCRLLLVKGRRKP